MYLVFFVSLCLGYSGFKSACPLLDVGNKIMTQHQYFNSSFVKYSKKYKGCLLFQYQTNRQPLSLAAPSTTSTCSHLPAPHLSFLHLLVIFLEFFLSSLSLTWLLSTHLQPRSSPPSLSDSALPLWLCRRKTSLSSSLSPC